MTSQSPRDGTRVLAAGPDRLPGAQEADQEVVTGRGGTGPETNERTGGSLDLCHSAWIRVERVSEGHDRLPTEPTKRGHQGTPVVHA